MKYDLKTAFTYMFKNRNFGFIIIFIPLLLLCGILSIPTGVGLIILPATLIILFSYYLYNTHKRIYIGQNCPRSSEKTKLYLKIFLNSIVQFLIVIPIIFGIFFGICNLFSIVRLPFLGALIVLPFFAMLIFGCIMSGIVYPLTSKFKSFYDFKKIKLIIANNTFEFFKFIGIISLAIISSIVLTIVTCILGGPFVIVYIAMVLSDIHAQFLRKVFKIEMEQ